MTVTPTIIEGEVIYEGATYDAQWERSFFPYPVTWAGEAWRKADGTVAPEGDRTLEDYTGCTARMQIRESVDAGTVISELTTENNGILLSGPTLRLRINDTTTSSIGSVVNWTSAIGQVEVVRTDGTVERQYEIHFTRSKESTK